MPKPGFWPERELWPPFNFGHLWFLEHLLVYALLYAAARAFIPADRASAARNPPTHGAIAAYAVLLAATTFVIRIWYPQDRWIGFLGFIQMEPAHIAQYASLFVIGLLAGPRRWLETMPTRRGLAWLAVSVGLAAFGLPSLRSAAPSKIRWLLHTQVTARQAVTSPIGSCDLRPSTSAPCVGKR